MDDSESNIEHSTIDVTRRTVIETGTSALLLTTLPSAAFAARPIDDTERSPPL